MMAHAQKPDFVFRRNGRIHLNRQGRQFSRILAAEVFASAVVMLDTSSSEVVWRVLATHSIRQFPLHFPSRASPCAITFQLDSNTRQSYRSLRGDVTQTIARCTRSYMRNFWIEISCTSQFAVVALVISQIFIPVCLYVWETRLEVQALQTIHKSI